LPDIKPYYEQNNKNGIPKQQPEDFLNIDYTFTDLHYGKACDTPTLKKSNKFSKLIIDT